MSNPNVNCLLGMRCPNKECGSYGPFYISVEVTMRITDEGSDPAGDEQWDNGSYCACAECEHEGTVSVFTDPEAKE